MNPIARPRAGARRRLVSCVLALAALSLAGATGAAPLAAQVTMYKPQTNLDPARRQVKDRLLVTRDTLRAVEASASRFAINPRGATPSLTYGRLRTMRASCQAAQRQLVPTRETVLGTALQGQRIAAARQELVAAMNALSGTFTRCDSLFNEMSAPERRDDARFDAIRPAQAVQADIRRYERAVARYFSAAGIEVRPLGAGRSPLDG